MTLLVHSVALFVGYWLASICEWILHNWCRHETDDTNYIIDMLMMKCKVLINVH